MLKKHHQKADSVAISVVMRRQKAERAAAATLLKKQIRFVIKTLNDRGTRAERMSI